MTPSALALETAQRDYADERLASRSATTSEVAHELRALRDAGDRIRTVVGGLKDLRDTSHSEEAWVDLAIDSMVDGLSHLMDCDEAESVIRAAAKHDPCAAIRQRLRGLPTLRQVDAQVRTLSDPDLMAAMAGHQLESQL